MTSGEGVAPVLLKTVNCDMCGILFAIPAALYDRLLAFRGTVCCPSGHVRLLADDPPQERRVRQLEALVAKHAEQLVAAKAENAKLRRSIVDGLLGPTAPEAS